MSDSVELHCPQCTYATVCGTTSMIGWLRRARLLKRDVTPELDLLAELFRASAGKFACPDCGAVGLAVRDVDDGDDEAWGMARKCDGCGRPIPRERVEALPNVRLCVACQSGDDRGEAAGERDFCPRCGSVMVVRQSGGAGLARYALVCPACRK